MSSVDDLSGALLGVLALFSGFCSEMVVMATVAPIYAYWRVRYDGLSIVNDDLDVK